MTRREFELFERAVNDFSELMAEHRSMIELLRRGLLVSLSQRNDFLRLAADFAADDVEHLQELDAVIDMHRAQMMPTMGNA